jgi:hypothetical protein
MNWRSDCSWGWADPGPCPICGVAHTACTAETAARPAVARDPQPPRAPFTTKDYKRKPARVADRETVR